MGTCLLQLPVISCFPKKPFLSGGMFTLIPPFIPWFAAFVNTWKHSELERSLCQHDVVTGCCTKRSGRNIPRTLTHSTSCSGLVQGNGVLRVPMFLLHSANCPSYLSCFMGSSVWKGKRWSPLHRSPLYLCLGLHAQNAWGSRRK